MASGLINRWPYSVRVEGIWTVAIYVGACVNARICIPTRDTPAETAGSAGL